MEDLKGRRLGRVLTKMGVVTRDQVQEALGLQENRQATLGQLLIELGYVEQEQLNGALGYQQGMDTVDLGDFDIPPAVIAMIPAEMANTYHVLPLQYDEKTKKLTIAMRSADNYQALDTLRLMMGFNVEAVLAPPDQLEKRIGQYYGEDEESLASLVADLADEDGADFEVDGSKSIDLEAQIEMANDNRVVRLLNLVLLQAIKDKASDIHFEPFDDEFKMRYRIDGVLYEMIPPPKHLAIPIVSRIKVMANLDIAERRLPQDGRIELTVGEEPVDLRVAVLPTMFGESVVLRILDRSNVSLDLAKVGMRDDDLDAFRQLIRKPNGIVIVTGPTGSGKTTTLYSALSELNGIKEKILTAEDPVEYDIDGLIQVQVNPAVGLTFAAALRSFLRQDPDIVLIGETRDLETAQIAVQASLTGHLVFTTLHTNDAPSSIARLLDLGLENFLITATIEGILAQRLIRRICPRCKETYEASEDELYALQLTLEDLEGRKLYRGRGCEYCNHSGYKGRMGLFEIMILDDDMRELIMKQASTQLLRNESRKRGMRTLRQSGLMALYDGMTTIEEIIRETMVED
ncbi:GspE/PulE family protein [Phycisphaera mikurensis]|uniref:Type IV pilus assembly protein PilB n=1 Tax=Phycisphaera mikurensis (strain NBRC 102666 / KCTC 22515 / FYK2301M01) TaxID=1142394 RepID=I0IFZ3_PHYMF|nr:ATPase, T2SS/T4P/T4SS family [Phycisphaera mikurensis]MBB6440433.1 type IV pilus assembly protein PilB [Phycisphaera mikurensis]BAM04181.1 type IV pilus assembly protein PilB [Phycisphaera mikurensis NBRC 102666]